MRLLLDTHILLWLTLTPDAVPRGLYGELLNPDHELVLSAANAWEIAIKFHSGKLPEGQPFVSDFGWQAQQLGASVLNITPAHAARAGALEWAHRDPFDRMLVAQALAEDLRLVTLDGRITSFAGAPIFGPGV